MMPAPRALPPLSLHDALPISFHRSQGAESVGVAALIQRVIRADVLGNGAQAGYGRRGVGARTQSACDLGANRAQPRQRLTRSEEHTSELQSRGHLVCRLLLEK